MSDDLKDIERRIKDGIYGNDWLSGTTQYDACSALAEIVAEVDRLRLERAECARLLVETKKEGARSTVAERATERTAVVAWLGAEVDAAMEMHLPVRAATFLECAEAIERGAHRREETE
jgi:hypothetical protein